MANSVIYCTIKSPEKREGYGIHLNMEDVGGVLWQKFTVGDQEIEVTLPTHRIEVGAYVSGLYIAATSESLAKLEIRNANLPYGIEVTCSK